MKHTPFTVTWQPGVLLLSTNSGQREITPAKLIFFAANRHAAPTGKRLFLPSLTTIPMPNDSYARSAGIGKDSQ